MGNRIAKMVDFYPFEQFKNAADFWSSEAFVQLGRLYRARLKGEFCFCPCLPLLPGFACSIHSTWGPPFSRALYMTLQ